MLIEGYFFRQKFYSSYAFEGGETMTDLECAASTLVFICYIVLYLVLVFVALYTAYNCNRNNPVWLVLNTFISVLFPSLYLIIHPNLVLSHNGPSSYCSTR